MNLQTLFEWISLGVISAGVYVLYDLAKDVKELNIKMARILERLTGHDNVLHDHEQRLRELE